MQLQYLREFRALALRLNFSITAEELFITQPALSNHIKAIEDEFGVALLDRGKGKQPQLTKAGVMLLNKIDELIENIDEIKALCLNLQQNPSLVLNVRLPIYVDKTTEPLITYTKHFIDANKDIDIVFKSGTEWEDPIEDLLSGNIDCCLCLFLKVSV
jgi:DNA-binding transcriptional LysR family regulator